MQETKQLLLELLPIELWNTFYMVFAAGLLATIAGLPLGILLTMTDQGGLCPRPWLYKSMNILVAIGRSFPFAILMIALIPFTRWIIGTSLGTTAAIVPLAIAAIPFIARLFENALKQIGAQTIEAARMMGSTNLQIIGKVLLQEALPGLINAVTMTLVTLVSYSAMAGMVGGGGLGKVAIQYGYQRFNLPVMVVTVVLLILFVQCLQWIGQFIVRSLHLQRGTGL